MEQLNAQPKAAILARPMPDWLIIMLTGCTFFSVVVMNYIISPTLPAIARQYSVSITDAGQLVTVYGLLFAVSALVLGSASAAFGKKRSMMAALALVAVATICTGLAPTFATMIIFRGVSGLAAAVVQSLNWAILADAVPYERRGRATGWVMQAGTLALLGGVPLGGILAGAFNWRFIFFGAGAFAFLIIAVLQASLLSSDTTGTASGLLTKTITAVRSLLARSAPRYALAISLLIWVAMFGFYTYLGAWLEGTFGLNEAQIGQATLALGVGYAMGGYTGGRLSERIGREPVILGGLLIMIAAFLLLPLSPNVPSAAVMTVVLGFGFFFAYSAQVTAITEILPDERSTGMAANYFATYVGAAIGARLGGWVLPWAGWRAVGWVSAAAGVCAILLVLASRSGRGTSVRITILPAPTEP